MRETVLNYLAHDPISPAAMSDEAPNDEVRHFIARFPEIATEAKAVLGIRELPPGIVIERWEENAIRYLVGRLLPSFQHAAPGTPIHFTPGTLGEMIGAGMFRIVTPAKCGVRFLMQVSRRVTLLALRACEVADDHSWAISANDRRESSLMVRLPTWPRYSARRRSASLRSLVLSDRRNCLSPLLSKA